MNMVTDRLPYRFTLPLIFVLFIVTIAGVSCSHSQQQARILSDAERIAGEYPDSALTLLDGIEPSELTIDSLKARYHLLKASIHDSQGHLMLSDSLITYSADYHKDKDLSKAVCSATLAALYDFWIRGEEHAILRLDSVANRADLPDSLAIFPLRKRTYWNTKIFDVKGNRSNLKRLISIDRDSSWRHLYNYWLYTDYLFNGQNDSSIIILNELID